MSLVNIRAELKSIVDGIKAANNIANVYDYPITHAGSTPAVVILDDVAEEEYESTAQNQSNTHWIIRVLVEKRETQAQDSTQVTTLLTLIDALMVELRKASNATLNCDAHSLIIEEVTPTEAGMQGDIPVFFKDIRLMAQSFKTIV